MIKEIKLDLQAAKERDPASRSKFFIFFYYPGFKALYRHRIEHWFYNHNMHFFARYLAYRTRKKTCIDIHPGAKIGTGVFIDHGCGVVIGETAVVGNNVTIYQQVTLGGTGKESGKRHPTINDNVMIAAGAKILGPINIGEHSKIGAGSVVLKDVPAHSTVVGIPGRIVKRKGQKVDGFDHNMMPDPILDELNKLKLEIKKLTKELKNV